MARGEEGRDASGHDELIRTHRKLPPSVEDGDERLALEDDLAGGKTPALGSILMLHDVRIGRGFPKSGRCKEGCVNSILSSGAKCGQLK